MRIARKFTLAVIAGIVIVHAAAAVYRVERERDLFEETAARDAEVLGRAVGHAVEKTWTTYGKEAAMGVVAHATEREDQVIRWVHIDATPGTHDAPRVTPEQLKAVAHGETVVARVDGRAGATMYTYVPVPTAEFRHGAVEVAYPLSSERRYLEGSLLSELVVTGVLIVMSAGLTWLLGIRLIGRPVGRLVEQTRAIGGGQLNRRLRLSSNDELGDLAKEIDQMSEQLEEARNQIERETQSRVDAVQQLRHADRLKTVGSLASGIAHELGTPINVVEGHAALLQEDPEASEAVQESTTVIVRQCKRMAEIIRQLLDFARRDRTPTQESDAMEVAQQTLDMLTPMANKRSVQLKVAGEAPQKTRVGFEELQQVLANLVLNGLHATQAGGEILIAVERRDVTPPGQPDEVPRIVVTVSDNGVGMDEDVAERVFEPFFTTKDVGEGTGLGLAVVYGIVQDHDGFIELESKRGQGTTFRVYLPVDGARA